MLISPRLRGGTVARMVTLCALLMFFAQTSIWAEPETPEYYVAMTFEQMLSAELPDGYWLGMCADWWDAETETISGVCVSVSRTAQDQYAACLMGHGDRPWSMTDTLDP